MMKKTLILSLVLIFILGVFGTKVCLAKLAAPSNTEVIAVGEGSAKVGWQWAGSGMINRFVLSYRISGTDEDWTKRYPSSGVQQYTLMGLIENTTYEWTIMAEAADPSNNSSEASGPNFTTESSPVNGNGNGNGGIPIGIENPLTADTLEEAINRFINFLFYLAIAVVPILIIYAGFLLLTSHGDSKQLSKAKTIILWTLVAFAIILFAKGLPSIVKGVMGG